MSQPEHVAIPASSRDKILDTAEALFARRGFEGVGLREVAARSGLSKSALFHYFPTKLDLYMAVLSRILGDLETAIAQIGPAADGELSQLVRIIDALVDALVALPTRAPLLLRTLFESELRESDAYPEADAMLQRLLGCLSQVMVAGVESGRIRPVAVPHALHSLVGMVVFHFASGEFGDDLLGSPVYSAAQIRRFKEFIFSFIESGLAAHPSVDLHEQGDPRP